MDCETRASESEWTSASSFSFLHLSTEDDVSETSTWFKTTMSELDAIEEASETGSDISHAPTSVAASYSGTSTELKTTEEAQVKQEMYDDHSPSDLPKLSTDEVMLAQNK